MAVAGAVALLASSAAVSGAVTGASAATTTVLNLGLNESSGAPMAVDSNGMRHNGQIGSHVVLNGAYARFDKHPQGEAVLFGNEHLITIQDATAGSGATQLNFASDLDYVRIPRG